METNIQRQIAFYLTGRRDGAGLLSMDQTYRPALFARFGDLSSLRYDFPLVLNRKGKADRAVLSLTTLVNDAVTDLGDDPERDRIARHGYQIEAQVRRELAGNGPGDFATIWHTSAAKIAESKGDEIKGSAMRLWNKFDADGDIFDADAEMPSRTVRHAWTAVQAAKAASFREKAQRLLLKLRDILAAERENSAAGRMPERLRAGVGSAFAATFDFSAMASILVEAKPGFELSDTRRTRIQGLIKVLEEQRFYPLNSAGPEPYDFAFLKCSDALTAYQERHGEAVELVKTLAIAELESKGEYRESVHDLLFEGFGFNGLDADELAELPDYLVCANVETLDPVESAQVIELLAAGLPIKILVQTDDVLSPSVVAEGHVALGLRSRQFVDTAIGLTDVYVLQSSSSHLVQKRDSLMRGLSYDGPALFSIFSGANEHTGDIPAYLVAAAAMESRVFPALVYDPSAGRDWADRLIVDDNPSPGDDWPVHVFDYEDVSIQSRSEKLAFTLADFMLMDDRFFRHYSIVPKADWADEIIPIPEALEGDLKGMPGEVPYVTLVDEDDRLQKAIIDDRMLLETRRCLTMWHSLQELGGIHNSHAERLLDRERKALAETAAAVVPPPTPAVQGAQPAAAEPVAAVEAVEPEPASDESHGDEPYIETARCTSCNECTNLNPRMFAYNAEKQAYIADPEAGTYRQLVEAAEGCQVSIIHPGKPRNLKEPGLDDLLRRAEPFM